MALSMIWFFIIWVAAPPAERWLCRNDLEIRCNAENCEVDEENGYTPMSVNFDDSGFMSVCAYSGCWEGTGTVIKSEDFVILTGHDLAFSTSPDSAETNESIVIVLDRSDHVAILKAGAFSHPLLCEQDAQE